MGEKGDDTITITIPQAMRGIITACIIAGGGGVSYYVASGGTFAKADSENHKALDSRITRLEKDLKELSIEVSGNTDRWWSMRNTRWKYKDQQIWSDLLQERNPDLDVPNPRNGN